MLPTGQKTVRLRMAVFHEVVKSEVHLVYFAVMKLSFMLDEEHPGVDTSAVKHDLQVLVEKLRARFRIAILSGQVAGPGDPPTIAVASLAHSEESLTRQLDSICEFCESSGFGRIDMERTLLDHIDSFGDDDDGEGEGNDDEFDRSH